MITREDWLKALEEAQMPHTHDADAMTVAEFAAMLNITQWAAGHRLRAMLAAGRVVKTWKQGYNASGKRMHLVAYRLARQPKTCQ